MSTAELPSGLRAGIDALLEGVSRNDLARRAALVSDNYRQGGASRKTILSPQDGLAYLLSRLPATYAAVMSALFHVKQSMPDFAPATLLDVGCGPGTAGWAACEVFPSLASAVFLDDSAIFRTLGKSLAADHPVLGQAPFRDCDLMSARSGLPSADLVIASYALGELRQPPLGELWNAAQGVLLIVEPGTPAGYANIVSWRAMLLQRGAMLAAPCPHEELCPIEPPDWCHFAQRLPRRRDHMILKNATVPFEDEKFSYIAVARMPVTARPEGRLLLPPRLSPAGIACKTCTHGRIDTVTASKRDKPAFKALDRLRWGDGLDNR